MLREPLRGVCDPAGQVLRDSVAAASPPHRLHNDFDGLWARQHRQRQRRKTGNRRAGRTVLRLHRLLQDLTAVLQASADHEDRAAVLAFVQGGEVLPPGAVNVLDLVDGQKQRPTVPPTHLHGLPQQVVQRQIRLHAQLESPVRASPSS